MIDVKSNLDILGKSVRDKVTKFEGVASSVLFDVDGDVRVCVEPKAADNKNGGSFCFCIKRAEVVDDEPVMTPPKFNFGFGARFESKN